MRVSTFICLAALIAILAVTCTADATTSPLSKLRRTSTHGRRHIAHGHKHHYIKSHRVHADTEIPVVFATKYSEAGQDTLTTFLNDVSNPLSPNYGKYAAKDTLDKMLFDATSFSKTLDFLHAHKATNIRVKGGFIKAHMKTSVVEKQFQTEVYHWIHTKTKKNIRKADAYTIPEVLNAHIDFIGYLSYFPAGQRNVKIQSFESLQSKAADGTVTPQTINSFYHIDNNVIDRSDMSHACFEDGQDIDPADLTAFQTAYGIPAQNITRIVGPNDPTQCTDPNQCGEASLDFEYLMAIAQGATTTFWAMDPNDQHPFMDWLIAMGTDPKAPTVNSVSYGEVEQQVPSDVTTRFNTEIQKINARGITVVVSSGDDGVANFVARSDSSQCGFNPSYPASSPFVTAVGATQGPESGKPEVACSSATGGVITVGGGFSTIWATPSYQISAVNTYLKTAGSTLPPTGQFNTKGRGYPDVSLLGYNYEVVVGGQTFPVSGTSASAPVFAAFLSLINNARKNAGKSVVGFVNPALYQFAASNPSIFNDITKGENNCAAENQPQVCCKYGFTAIKGWDPVTGLGSVNFTKLKAAFMALP